MPNRRVPPPLPGAPYDSPAHDLLDAVLAAQRAEADRIEGAWEAWHRAFGVMQRDPGRQVWAMCCRVREDPPMGPTPEAAVTEARRVTLNRWRNWSGMYPEAMTRDCYDVTEAIILGFAWQPFLDNPFA